MVLAEVRMHTPLWLAAILAIATPAHAWEHTYTSDGHKVRWTQPEVSVGVASVASPALREATRHALEEWALATDGRLAVREARAEQPDILVTVVRDEDWHSSSDYIALASVQHDGQGRVQRAWIEVRASHDSTEGATFDLRAVMTHELGHALGLAHEHQVPDATMAPTIAPGPSPRKHLHEDDIEGIHALYPERTDTPRAATCASVPAHATSFFVLAALAGLRRPTRRAPLSPVPLVTQRRSS